MHDGRGRGHGMSGSAVSHQASMVSVAFSAGLSVGLSAESVDRRAAVGACGWVEQKEREGGELKKLSTPCTNQKVGGGRCKTPTSDGSAAQCTALPKLHRRVVGVINSG